MEESLDERDSDLNSMTINSSEENEGDREMQSFDRSAWIFINRRESSELHESFFTPIKLVSFHIEILRGCRQTLEFACSNAIRLSQMVFSHFIQIALISLSRSFEVKNYADNSH